MAVRPAGEMDSLADMRHASPFRQARTYLREGRYAQTLERLRIARRRPLEAHPALMALIEVDALLNMRRYRDALSVIGRALRRRPDNVDLAVRLRVARALTLWNLGSITHAARELTRADALARLELTRARVAEIRTLLAWTDHNVDQAIGHLGHARALYQEQGSHAGVERTWRREAAILRDLGKLDEALQIHDQRIEVTRGSVRRGALARAYSDRGSVLTTKGRWGDARKDFSLAASIFRDLQDSHAQCMATMQDAIVELAIGDLDNARRMLDVERTICTTDNDDPRTIADVLLLKADVYLTCSDASAAERAAAEAAALFGLAHDSAGQCRGRIRHSQALLALKRDKEALKQARIAVRQVPKTHCHLRGWAHLALGRVLLRTGAPVEARGEFVKALESIDDRREMVVAAQLGMALAEHAPIDDPRITSLVQELESFGHRALLALCLKDVSELGAAPASAITANTVTIENDTDDDVSVATLIELAQDVRAGGEHWPKLLTALGHFLRALLPWTRIVLVDNNVAWQTRTAGAVAVPLPSDDLAWHLPQPEAGIAVVDLKRDRRYRDHPTRALQRIGYSIVVPLNGAARLHIDLGERAEHPGRTECWFLRQIGRLIHPPNVSAERIDAQSFHGITGRSPAMQSLLQLLRQIAPTDFPVQIVGESGTGKELIARALHECSARRTAPYRPVNASSLSEALFEAHMFGHTKGAFTGADAARDGFVAAAHGGTLFLDEVADLSLVCQAKLLRFAQDGEYYRLGETGPRYADVRLVTATQLDLGQRAREGRFRADLLYRLQGEILRVPPLRERGGDILELARHFIHKAAERRQPKRTVPELSAEAARILESYQWPGNVRELEMQMRRLVALDVRDRIRPEHLPPRIRDAVVASRRSLRVTRLDHEHARIRAALHENGGNRSRAASALGLSRQGLLLKLRRLGIG